MIYTKSTPTDLESLALLPEPTSTGRLHTPIPHRAVYEAVTPALRKAGFEIGRTQMALANGNARWFAELDLKSESETHGTKLVLRNAHDMAFAAGMAIGEHTFICDNLMFSGDVVIARRHTPRILADLPGLAEDAVNRVRSGIDTQERRWESYRAAPLTESQVKCALVDAARLGAITSNAVLPSLERWYHPEFEQETEYGDSVLRFQQTVTAGYRGSSYAAVTYRSPTLVKLLDSLAGFDAASN